MVSLIEARRRIILGSSVSILPPTYKRVQYLESSGTQWIQTGLKLDTTTHKFFYRVSPTAMRADAGVYDKYNGIMGAASSPQVAFYFNGWTVGNAGSASPYLPQVGRVYDLTYSNNFDGKYFVDGLDTGLRRAGNMTCNFFWVQSNSANVFCRLYAAKSIDIDGNLAYNMIPCVRVTDSEPGLYDTVSKTFYTNKGTGKFIIPT